MRLLSGLFGDLLRLYGVFSGYLSRVMTLVGGLLAPFPCALGKDQPGDLIDVREGNQSFVLPMLDVGRGRQRGFRCDLCRPDIVGTPAIRLLAALVQTIEKHFERVATLNKAVGGILGGCFKAFDQDRVTQFFGFDFGMKLGDHGVRYRIEVGCGLA